MKAQANWAFSSSGWMLLYLLFFLRGLLINHCHPKLVLGACHVPRSVLEGSVLIVQSESQGMWTTSWGWSQVTRRTEKDKSPLEAGGLWTFFTLEYWSYIQGSSAAVMCSMKHRHRVLLCRDKKGCVNTSLSTYWEFSGKSALYLSG